MPCNPLTDMVLLFVTEAFNDPLPRTSPDGAGGIHFAPRLIAMCLPVLLVMITPSA